MAVRSIKKALQQRVAYTNKNNVTISYSSLREMTRLNAQLAYYNKKLKIKGDTKERIKPSAVGEDYKKKMRRTKTTINYRKYARYKKRLATATPKWAKKIRKEMRRIKHQITNTLREVHREAGHTGTLSLPDIDTMTERDLEVIGTSEQILNYRMNLMETIRSNFSGLSRDLFNELMDAVNGMSYYEIHRLAVDNPTLLDHTYYGIEPLRDRLREFLEAINGASNINKFTEAKIIQYEVDIASPLTIGGKIK